MPITKEFKTIEQQIKGLEARGLKFRNRKKAAKILSRYNYFDIINGFETMLLQPNTTSKQYKNVYFGDFHDLYKFDMKLKQLTLFKVFDVESRLRTAIAYHFASINCNTVSTTMNYVNPIYYQAPSRSNANLRNRFRTFDLFRVTEYYPNGAVKRRSYIDQLKRDKDYVGQYANPPFWVVIKSLPLGSLYYLYVFLTTQVKTLVLADFGFGIAQSTIFEQAVYVLKEVRNQCAHLELITRFRLKRYMGVNSFNDITNFCGLSRSDLNYMDVVRIFKMYGKITDVKFIIFGFYIKMCIKGRKKIADKVIAKMGRKNIFAWICL